MVGWATMLIGDQQGSAGATLIWLARKRPGPETRSETG